MAQLVIKFNSNPFGKDFTVLVEVGGVALPIAFEDFVTARTGANKVAVSAVESDMNVIASSFVTSWNLDYGNWGGTNNALAVISGTGSSVTIDTVNPAWQITAVSGDSITDSDIIVDSLINPPIQDDSAIVLDSFSIPSSNFCTNAIANLIINGGNGLYNIYELPSLTLVEINVASPVTLDTVRGTSVNYRVIDTTAVFIGEILINTPRKIIGEDISLGILNLTSGVTLTISVAHIHGDILPLTYSLDDITYQTSNIYTGLAPGTFTIYVKDAWGCVSSTTVVLDGVTDITETIAIISEINALRFSLIDTEKKNHKNTLSCDELKSLTYPYFHRYTEGDTIPTQFKTNAQYINIYGIDGNGNQTAIAEAKRTDNIGQKAKSTSTYFNLESGRSGIYFGVVDLLDYDTEVVINETNFGFTLPEWANKKGDIVLIEGIGEVEVDSIGYSEFYSSFILEFNITYTGVAVEKKISAIYNLQPYEIYEFDTVMSTMPELFNLVIEFGVDSENITYQYISEKIKRFIDTDRYFEIDYSDPLNKGHMVYQTGIAHKIRLEGVVDYIGEQETGGYNGDSEYFVTNNTVYDTQRFTFYRLSSEMVSKLRLIFPHDSVTINGLNYKIADAPEINTDVNNNYKTFSITLKTSGDKFLTSEQEQITGTAEGDAIAGAIEASKGKALILHTKTNG